jgi:hypothetical protein
MTQNVTKAEANQALNELVVSQVLDLIRSEVGNLPDEKLSKIKVGKLMSFKPRRDEPRIWFAVIEDYDLDAILVTFDCDGCVELHHDGLDWLSFHVDTLFYISQLAEEVMMKSATR